MGCGASKDEAKKEEKSQQKQDDKPADDKPAAADDKKDDDAPHPVLPIPADFPVQDAQRLFYQNWARSTMAQNVLHVSPKTDEEVVQIVNWAVKNNWKVRPVGIKHNWSPITIVNQGVDGDLDGYVLVSLMEHMKKVTVDPGTDTRPPTATAQLGVGQLEFLTEIEKAPGGNGDIGFGIIHTPAPNGITLGGLLAIDGHGTCVTNPSDAANIDQKWANYGTYSNAMVACKAIVWDEEKQEYAAKQFKREDDDIAPFLAHVGNAFLLEATLQVVPNYYMRCISRLDISWETMFPKTPENPEEPQEDSMQWFMKKHGRAEAIWFPFTDNPWLKVWEVTGNECPEGSRKVDNALNYPFSDELGPNITKLFRSLTGADKDKEDELVKEIVEEEKARYMCQKERADSKKFGHRLGKFFDDLGVTIADNLAELVGGPKTTPFVSRCVELRVAAGMVEEDSDDIWGASKNTLIYVRSDTLRVTANGYAILTSFNNVQECMYVFAQMYHKLIEKYAADGKFPIACPLEIRVTGIDNPAPILGDVDVKSPPLSALYYDEDCKKNGWDCALWLDVLSLPDAPFSNDFYVEMEEMMMEHEVFHEPKSRLRPEWSKGWGYAKDGPWTSVNFRNHTRKGLEHWNATMDQLKAHDPKNVYSNPWMDAFFTKVDADGAPQKE